MVTGKRSCKEMNPHFFTAPFYFAFIWFKVQGSGFRWRLSRLFLEDGILALSEQIHAYVEKE